MYALEFQIFLLTKTESVEYMMKIIEEKGFIIWHKTNF